MTKADLVEQAPMRSDRESPRGTAGWWSTPSSTL